MAGPHSLHGRPDGATWKEGSQVKGPRVSGPWLEYWGDNANALLLPSLYTRQSSPFLPCGTKFLGSFKGAGHVVARWALDVIAST